MESTTDTQAQPQQSQTQTTQTQTQTTQSLTQSQRSLHISENIAAHSHRALKPGQDSNIKRNTSFIKKLKTLSDEQKETLAQEAVQLNLTRYISEVVAAIADAKLKTTDIPTAVRLCSLLHQRYAEFSGLLQQALLRVFTGGGKGSTSTGGAANSSEQLIRKRSTLRLLVELYLCGVTTEAGHIYKVVQDLVAQDQSGKDKDQGGYPNLSLIVSFVRTAGEDFLGLKSKKQAEAAEQDNTQTSSPPKELEMVILPAEQRKAFLDLLSNYFDSASAYLVAEHKELRAKEKENHHILETRGELTEAQISAYDKLRKSYEKLLTNITTLADLLSKNLPELPEDQNTTRIEAGVVISTAFAKDSGVTNESIWDDDDTRSFYEDLPDLRVLLPGVLFGDSESSRERDKEKDKDKDKDKESEKDAKKEGKEPPETAAEESDSKKDDKNEEKDSSVAPIPTNLQLENLLARLPQCVNRDLIDQASIDFCYLNSKHNRKKLVKTLFNVPRTNLALIPYYSRMVATLSRCMKDVGPMLVSMLEEEFHYLFQKKDQTNIETKIRNIRFIGELTKFRICPTSLTLTCLKMCLDDFMHHNIDITCNLLETAGRFLYRSPETHIRTKNLLEMMMRLKNVQNLVNRLDTMVENAYYYCIPPERDAKSRLKEESPIRLYIKHLIYHVLNKNTTKYVLKQLRKMPWDTEMDFILKCLLETYKGKYSNIHLVASLVSGLASYHELLGIKLVDQLLENIRVGLDESSFKIEQKQIMNIKFLGELYNYCMIESQVVFDTLYSLISTGYSDSSDVDPPHDCFRIRLVCTLLDTCGQYFDRGSSKKKLDKFLVYFQRYILSKTYVPMDVEFMISDCFESLRPELVRFQTFEEAQQEVLKIEQEEYGSTNAPSQVTQSQPEEDSISESDTSEGTEGEEDEDEEGEDDEDDEEGEEGASEEEEDVVSFRTPARAKTVEDEEFEREFNKIMQESLESRKHDAPRTEIPLPMSILRGTGRNKTSGSEVSASPPQNEEVAGMEFKVLMRKGNKPMARSLSIPLDSYLAQQTLSQQEAEREEQKELKRLVLQYEEREEENQAAEELEAGFVPVFAP